MIPLALNEREETKMKTVVIEGVEMSVAAAEWVQETGTSPAADLAGLKNGDQDAGDLRNSCFDGADEDRRDAIEDYLSALGA